MYTTYRSLNIIVKMQLISVTAKSASGTNQYWCHMRKHDCDTDRAQAQ